MDFSAFLTDWIWTPEWSAEDDRDVHIVFFRKTVETEQVPDSCKIRITADARYKLYVNGAFVEKGPQKALDRKEWFVDTVDIAAFLKPGRNAVAVEVIRFPETNYSASAPMSNDSLIRTPIPHLFVKSLSGQEQGIVLDGRSGWKCSVNREITIVGEDCHPAPIHAQEQVCATDCYKGWKLPEYDDSAWADAQPKLIFDLSMSDAPANQVDRTIPYMRHVEKKFDGVVCFRDAQGQLTEGAGEAWNAMLAGPEASVTIPANTAVTVEISAGVLECGYLEYAFTGGAGAKLSTLCSECYAYPPQESSDPFSISAPVKGDRTDYRNGRLYGHTSTYTVSGYGTPELPETYEPFWFRTFRYIQLAITTAAQPLTIRRFQYRETGYPLVIKNRPEFRDETMEKIWQISVRTLERCMHETYFDCPFYEQLQYAMDSRNEILYTYTISGDDRLARQTMEAFKRSQRPDGMTNSDAPTEKSNVIPGFSIYYVMMVYDHMRYFGNRQLVKDHFGAIDQVLNFFDNNLAPNGMVGKVGGPIMLAKYWSFIDWSRNWKSNGGVPNATNLGTGSVTMESLLYIYGLEHAAELAEFIGRPGVAEEYRQRAAQVKAAVRAHCLGTYVDASGAAHTMIQDGPGIDDYSAHCQIFGLLTDTVTVEEGRQMLLAAINAPELAQASVSFMFYLFRALEKAGLYDLTDRYWDIWRRMLDNNMTTCVENDTDERSDCHAWASLACYEFGKNP